MGLTYYCRNALTDAENIKEPGGGSPWMVLAVFTFFSRTKWRPGHICNEFY